MSTATARVFGSYELAEHIFLYVPPNYIINLLRVCRSIRQIVQDSDSIRRIRFLDPSPIGSHGVKESIFYAFSALKLNTSFVEEPIDESDEDEDDSEGDNENKVRFECQVHEATVKDALPRTRIEFEWKCLYAKPEEYWNEIASQQLFNPPIRRASFGISSPKFHDKPGYFVKVWKDIDDAGITVGTMKRLFDDCLQQNSNVNAELATCSVVVEVVAHPMHRRHVSV